MKARHFLPILRLALAPVGLARAPPASLTLWTDLLMRSFQRLSRLFCSRRNATKFATPYTAKCMELLRKHGTKAE